MTSGKPGRADGFFVTGTSPRYTIAFCLEKCWAVHLKCSRCDREPVLWHEDELKPLPPTATLGAIAKRVKCAACGSDKGKLYTRTGYWGAQAKLGRADWSKEP